MKKYLIMAALAAALLSVSCNKEQNAPDEPTAQQEEVTTSGEIVTIKATIPEEITKVAGTYEDSKLVLAWSAGDKIRVADHSNPSGNYQDFTLISGEGTKNAIFSGTAVSASSFDISLQTTSWPADVLKQTQSEDESTAHLGYQLTLTGVDTYEDIAFTSQWASENGSGTFSQSGALHLQVTLPAGMAATVNKVTMIADQNIFGATGTMSIDITTPNDNGTSNTLDVFASVPASGVSIPSGTVLLFKFSTTDVDHSVYTRYYKTTSALTIAGGQLNKITLSYSTPGKFIEGDGSDSHPYLIESKTQMQSMSNLLSTTSKVYFKMMADVDLGGDSWTPLNTTSPYNKAIDFDGNGKTIDHLSSSGKYASFVGVLNGSLYNTIFDNASITSETEKAGVVAAYLGSSSSSVSADIHDVIVKNSSVTNTTNHVGAIAGYASKLSSEIDNCHAQNVDLTGVFYVGGLLGVLDGEWTVKNCSSSGTVKSTNTVSNKDICLGGLVGDMKGGATVSKCYSSVTINQTTNGRDIGGLIGRLQVGTVEKSYCTGDVTGQQRNVGGLVGCITLTSDAATISDSYATGNVSGVGGHSGGFVGLLEKGTVNISRCYATGTVSGAFGLGGLIGYQGSSSLTAEDCAAWNSSITPVNFGAANWSSGAVIGVAYPSTVRMANLFRSPNMALKAFWGTVTGYTYVLEADYDHPDVDGASTSTYLVVKDKSSGVESVSTTSTLSGGNNPIFPYQGKHVLGDTTLSTLASTAKGSGGLGWSSEVWDFTGDLPTLK